MKRMQIFRNRPVYLGLLILEISKIVMYAFWYDNVQPKYGESQNMFHGYRQLCSLHKKQKTSTQTLKKMLKQDSIVQVMNQVIT